MVKTYRATRQWDQWLTQYLGAQLLLEEQIILNKSLAKYFGNQVLLMGSPWQGVLLNKLSYPCSLLLTPFISKNKNIPAIEGDFYELPFFTGSVDLVILPHILEYAENPRKLLTEACRIVKPEGHIVILGFNPYSLWGLKKLFTTVNQMPWVGNFIAAGSIKKWLRLADFEMVKHTNCLFRPPIQTQGLYNKLSFLEWIGKAYKPFGGVYMLIAKAKVIPLTPIRLRWQQKLTKGELPIMGPSLRNPHDDIS